MIPKELRKSLLAALQEYAQHSARKQKDLKSVSRLGHRPLMCHQ